MEAAYSLNPGGDTNALKDEIVTMWPLFALSMSGKNSRAAYKTAIAFISNVFLIIWSLTSRNPLPETIPALLIKIVTAIEN